MVYVVYLTPLSILTLKNIQYNVTAVSFWSRLCDFVMQKREKMTVA